MRGISRSYFMCAGQDAIREWMLALVRHSEVSEATFVSVVRLDSRVRECVAEKFHRCEQLR